MSNRASERVVSIAIYERATNTSNNNWMKADKYLIQLSTNNHLHFRFFLSSTFTVVSSVRCNHHHLVTIGNCVNNLHFIYSSSSSRIFTKASHNLWLKNHHFFCVFLLSFCHNFTCFLLLSLAYFFVRSLITKYHFNRKQFIMSFCLILFLLGVCVSVVFFIIKYSLSLELMLDSNVSQH